MNRQMVEHEFFEALRIVGERIDFQFRERELETLNADMSQPERKATGSLLHSDKCIRAEMKEDKGLQVSNQFLPVGVDGGVHAY